MEIQPKTLTTQQTQLHKLISSLNGVVERQSWSFGPFQKTHIFISQGGGVILGWQSCSLFAGFRDFVGFWVIFGWFY
jgi:hypothetical protein